MLVDLPDTFQGPDCPSKAAVAKAQAEYPDFDFDFPSPQRLEKGVYLSHTNFSHDLYMAEIEIDEYPFSPWVGKRDIPESALFDMIADTREGDAPFDYGVCDRYQQILDRWPQIAADERPLIIALSQFTREDDPDWRWHKWGPYIGTQKPTREHIGDEPKIERVFVFHIYAL